MRKDKDEMSSTTKKVKSQLPQVLHGVHKESQHFYLKRYTLGTKYKAEIRMHLTELECRIAMHFKRNQRIVWDTPASVRARLHYPHRANFL